MSKHKILAAVHLYPPTHLCGGEFYLHQLLKFMQGKGHEVRVLLMDAARYGIKRIYEYDGVEVYPADKDIIVNCIEWSTCLMTHLDFTPIVLGYGSVFRKPVIHIVHNTHRRPDIVEANEAQYIVYNSEHAREAVGYNHLSTVLHPPCDWKHYDTEVDSSKSEYITLINLDHNKGGHILRQIAEAMPERKFIGVVGSYSEPAKYGQYTDQPSNVQVLPKTPTIKEVYAKTRILIMPSAYESWGRTATEAMASGIPVISTQTPGLRENCGKAGIYIQDRDNIAAWVTEIKKLDAAATYKKQSTLCRKRSRELDPTAELEALERWIVDHVRFNSQSKAAGVSTPANF